MRQRSPGRSSSRSTYASAQAWTEPPSPLRDRLAVVQAAQHAGLSLEEVGRAFAAFAPEHAPTKGEWAALARRWRPVLDARIAELQQVRDGLSMCAGCGCLSMRQCAIYNPLDTLGDSGVGARRIFPHVD